MIQLPSTSSDSGAQKCVVCSLEARGRHFGVISCRACAAFFRRVSSNPNLKIQKCKNDKNCQSFGGNGWFQCKKCRLDRCLKMGMTTMNFQFDRDPIKSIALPTSIEKFVGRPSFVINCDPLILKIDKNRNVIDCTEFVEKGWRILMDGCETPLQNWNSLQKMAFGLKKMSKLGNREVKTIKTYGEQETMAFWENDFLRAAKWFTYFDEFQNLPSNLKYQILASVWHVWSRLDKLAITAWGRRQNICGDYVMFCHKNEYSVLDMKNMELDLTWCSRLTNQQMQFFYDTSENNMTYRFAREMMDLNPTDVELSYMLSHLVLSHAGQRFKGEIQEICEKMMEHLSNCLHDYYVNERGTPRYSGRLAAILRLNRKIQREMLEIRSRLQLASIFDVHTVGFSHESFFEDL